MNSLNNGSLTLNSPLTQEQWNTLTDVELKRTKKIYFKTPSGRSVTFIPLSALDDLRKQITDFKRCVKSYNSDYLTGYLSALSVVEGMIAEVTHE